jgi:transposase-like protein
MKSPITKPIPSQPWAEPASCLFDNWIDPIETAVRNRVRSFIEALIESELDAALDRPRYGRRAILNDDSAEPSPSAVGHRHGKRTPKLTGTFGTTEITVPRARLVQPDGGTTEWKSKALRTYQRRTVAADAVIAGAYLAGTNTRRVRRALAALFGGGVGKDIVSRTWRKVQGDWEAWNARSLADEPIVRLILDGTAVRVRLDRKATAISPLVVIGVRANGQKVLLAAKSMGGESAEAWRAVLDDPIRRGLRDPELLIVDGAAELDKAIAAVWDGVLVQRCTVHKHRNLLAHAPERLHEEITADYTDMIYATTREEIGAPQGVPPQMASEASRGRRQPRGSRRAPVRLHAPAAEPMEERANNERDRTAARGVQATDQDADRAALRRNRRHAALGAARFRSDQHAQGRRLAHPRHANHRSAH